MAQRRSEKGGPSVRMLSTTQDITLQHAMAVADRKMGVLIVRAHVSKKEVFG